MNLTAYDMPIVVLAFSATELIKSGEEGSRHLGFVLRNVVQCFCDSLFYHLCTVSIVFVADGLLAQFYVDLAGGLTFEELCR